MTDLPLTGGCACGTVRFEVSEPPIDAIYCHCTRCQRRTGTAASMSVVIEPGSMTIQQGEDAIGEWQPEGGKPKAFCGNCGGALWAVADRETGVYAIRMAAFDSDPGIRASCRQHVASAAVWEPIPDDGVPRHERARPYAV